MILPYDYIRGLVEGEGSFSFCTICQWRQFSDGREIRIKRPIFEIRMHVRDEDLIRGLRNTLGLDDSVYVYDYQPKNKEFHRGKQACLMIRDTASLRNKIIPFFYGRLFGHKGKQFFDWLEKMGNEEMSGESQYLHRLYKKGIFEELSKKFF